MGGQRGDCGLGCAPPAGTPRVAALTRAPAKTYGIEITIFRELPSPSVDPEFAPPAAEGPGCATLRPAQLELIFAGGNHYDLALPLRYAEVAAAAQAILYEIVGAKPCPALPSDGPHGFRQPEFEKWREEADAAAAISPAFWKRGAACEALYTDGRWYPVRRPRPPGPCANRL